MWVADVFIYTTRNDIQPQDTSIITLYFIYSKPCQNPNDTKILQANWTESTAVQRYTRINTIKRE